MDIFTHFCPTIELSVLALSANFFCLSRWYYSTTIVVQIDQFGGGAAQQFQAINREMWVQKIDLNIPCYVYAKNPPISFISVYICGFSSFALTP